MDQALRTAEQQWGEADAADKHYQALSMALRAAGDVLDDELVALRKYLAVQFGRSDRDYQKLRLERASVRDEEGDPNAPPVPAAIPPANTGAQGPTS